MPILLLSDRVDLIIKSLSGLVSTDDDKISNRAIEGEFPKWKQKATLIAWNGTRPIAELPSGVAGHKILKPDNYLPTDLSFDASIQDADAPYVIFEVEPAINLDSITSGFMFCGDKLTGQSFIQLRDPKDYWTYSLAGNITSEDVYFFASGKRMQVWPNTIRDIHLNYLPVDPMNVSDFNPETDNYPVGEDVWAIMKAIAVYELTPPSLRPADLTKDSAPTSERMIRG
jgi:hypothetical protein